MAAKTIWHRYGTKLRHCHHMYRCKNQGRTSVASQDTVETGIWTDTTDRTTFPANVVGTTTVTFQSKKRERAGVEE